MTFLFVEIAVLFIAKIKKKIVIGKYLLNNCLFFTAEIGDGMEQEYGCKNVEFLIVLCNFCSQSFSVSINMHGKFFKNLKINNFVDENWNFHKFYDQIYHFYNWTLQKTIINIIIFVITPKSIKKLIKSTNFLIKIDFYLFLPE